MEPRSLSDEIELCGNLRNAIGKALKADAEKAAKVQAAADEAKAAELLVENEAQQLEANLAAAEQWLLQCTNSLEKMEVAAAHLKETNSFLEEQMQRSEQQISASAAEFEELRKRHLAFCKVQDEAHREMTCVESLLRTIVGQEETARLRKMEKAKLEIQIEELEKTKKTLEPSLEAGQETLETAKAKFESSKGEGAKQLGAIECCKRQQQQLRNHLERLAAERAELSAQQVSLQTDVARARETAEAELQAAAQQQKEAALQCEESIKASETKKREREKLERRLNELKMEMKESTDQMYNTMEKMKQLRQQDAALTAAKQQLINQIKSEKEKIAELKKKENLLEDFNAAKETAAQLLEALQNGEKKLQTLLTARDSALMEHTEMAALLENEKKLLNEKEKEIKEKEMTEKEETIDQKEEKASVASLAAVSTQQKEMTQALIWARKRADLELKKVDLAEQRLRDRESEKALLDEHLRQQQQQREEEAAAVGRLEEEKKMAENEILNLRKKEKEIQKNIQELREKEANANSKKEGAATQLLELREKLHKKYKEACEGVREEFRCHYSSMLAQTLEDERRRLAAEEANKKEAILRLKELIKRN